MSNCDLPDLSRLQLHVGVGPTETELRRELVRDRKVKKEIQMLENSDFVNNDESRKQRRAAAQKNHEANRNLLNPQHLSAIQFVRSMFAKGYVKMALYENIPPGWLVIEPVGLGRPISERMAQEDRSRYFDLPIWFPDGILSYTPFRGALLQVGFDVFVNFEGYKDRRWWAIEVPLAKSLDIFVNTWIYDQPFIDEDWARGGEGPYLANQVYTDNDTGAFEMAPSAQMAQTERNQLYVDYLQDRMKQEGIIELDKQLQLPAPTAEEKGAGEIPPSVEAGRPGLEPIVEEKDWPPTDKLEYWSMVIILVSIEMFKKFAPVSMAGAPTDLRMENKNKSDVMWTWEAIQGKYDKNEDNLITRLRIRVDAFIDDTEKERPIMLKTGSKRSVKEYLKTTIDTMVSRMALANKWPDTLLDDTHKGVLLKQLPSPPQSSQPSQLNAPEKDITHSDRVALEEMGIVQPPDEPDPVPPKGLSIMQVQQNTVEKAKKERKPMPGAYNPIVEYTQSLLYKKGKADVLDGYAKDFKAAHVILMPTLKDRGNYFYVHTEECDIEKPLAKVYEDGTNTVTDKNYTLGGVQYNMNTVFAPSSKYNKFEYSETTDPNRTYRIYAVHADDSQSVGLFGDKQMNNFYQQMVVKGIVMFSVNKSKAIQFFPEQYCCSNVWWWESKLNFLPSTLRFHKVGQGSFNVVYRLLRNASSTKNSTPPPDHFLFLPPTRVAYDMSLNQGNLKNAFASTKQNGILYRIAYFPDGDDFGIQGPMRELMMAGYAASKNIGPKIFAAYVIPKGAHPPMMKMNPGDEDEQLANPIYCANPGRKAGEKPSSPWYSSKMFWKDIVNEKGPEWSLMASPRKDWQYQETRTGGWQKMVVVMESYTADVTELRITNQRQKTEVVNKLFECFEKMGKAGILHCDMKPQNMVQRTWKEGKSIDWNKIEIRAIDFDPFFVKIVPWLPWEVIALINAVEYFAFLTCHSSHYFDSKLTIEKLAALNKTCNEQYPDGIAAAFRALKPNYDGMQRGPVNLNGKHNDRYDNKEKVPFQLYNMFSDEWEAARAFRRWTGWYMEQSCSDYGATSSMAPADTGMLARLLSWIKEKDASKAKFDPQNPGNVPFVDGEPRPKRVADSSDNSKPKKMGKIAKPNVTELSGIWRDRIVLRRVGHL